MTLIFFSFLILITIYDSLSIKKLQNLRKSFKKLTNSNQKQETNTQIIGNEDSIEYPGNQIHLVQQIKDQWEEYYKCLLDKKKSYDDKEEKPVIHLLLEGQYIELNCAICERPFQDYEELEWKYKPLVSDENSTEFDHLDLSHQMDLTDEKILKMYNVEVGYSGIYACFQGNTTTAVYVVEISNDQEIVNVTEEEINKDMKPLQNTQMEIYTEWSNWTECSACGAVGKMFKYGICMISLRRGNSDLIIGNNEKGAEIIQRFKTGIPCNSSYLPKFLKKYNEIRNGAAQIAVKFCKVPCPGPVVFEVVDRYGKLLEVANNSAGIFSALQKLPKLAPEVERKSITADFGGSVLISCPGNLLTDTPYTWKIKNRTIIPELIESQSSGRITIDLLNRLDIRRIRRKDSKTYSCWQRDRLAGAVRLQVEKKFKVRFDHHVLLISLILIIVTIILIGLKIIARHRQTKK